MKKKRLVIYVQGASYLSTSSKPLKKIISILYDIVRTKPNYSVSLPVWLTKKTFACDKIVTLPWKENINPLSKIGAIERLEKMIEAYKKEYEIILVGTSLGGDIVLETAENIKGSNIKSVFLIGSINESRNINLKKVKVFNIVSNNDTLEKIGIEIFAPISGSVILKGKRVKNIVLSGLRHDQLHQNEFIPNGKYKGQRLSNIIKANI